MGAKEAYSYGSKRLTWRQVVLFIAVRETLDARCDGVGSTEPDADAARQ
jgi:hypothetical protein